MNPMMVAQNRTARLAREASAPRMAYSTSTEKASAQKASREKALLRDRMAHIENIACGGDFCHVCGRCTEHFGEHTEEQLLAWAEKSWLAKSLGL